MKRKKVRKESGRKYNKFYDPENGLYNEQYWDDWNDYRDGYRNLFSDRTLIKPKYINNEHWWFKNDECTPESINKKIKKLNIRRKLMKS